MEKYKCEEDGYVTRNVLYQFVPAKSLPSSDKCGIKFYKWIWKDKEEWRMYKDGVKK
ncbi:MAG: hypothetical protein K6A82_01130 [Prevotella sp.]|nr:hypothetical protein [Prevotella sp.]